MTDSMKIYYADSGWNLLGSISSYPTISKKMDGYSTCTATVTDFEGALYSTWEPYDFIEMKIEDASSNIIFQGYLKGKIYTQDSLIIRLEGFGAKLDWTPYNKNHILEEGLIETCPAATGVKEKTAILRPDGDNVKNWSYPVGGTHYDDIDDDVEDPTVGDGNIIAAQEADDEENEEFTMTTVDMGANAEVTAITLHVYGRNNATLGNANMSVNVNIGGWQAAHNFSFTASNAWYSKTWSGLSASQANLDGLIIRFTSLVLGANEEQRIDTAYVTVTYNTAEDSLDLEQDDSDAGNPDFTWSNDQWINDRDVGILLVDNTAGISTQTWTVSTISTDKDEISGNAASCATADDGDTYFARDENPYPNVNTVTIGVSGVNISTSDDVREIRVYWKIGLYHYNINVTEKTIKSKIEFQIDKNGTWETLVEFTWNNNASGENVAWLTNPEGGYLITEDLTSYLEDSEPDNDYDQLYGMRILITPIMAYGTTYYTGVKVDYLTVQIDHDQDAISPVMLGIDDNGASWITCDGADFATSGIQVGDSFKIGDNTTKILYEIFAEAGVPLRLISTLTKYMARDFKGNNCMEALRAVCQLEGLHFAEDHVNKLIVVSKTTDFEDSAVDLAASDYERDWKYEDDCNHYKGVWVHGNAALNIEAVAVDADSTSLMWKQITDDTIMTAPDAQGVADTILAELDSKQPSIKIQIPFNSNLEVMEKVHLTLTRPTVAQAFYVIRRMDVFRRGEHLFQDLYLGLGSTPPDEKIANLLRQLEFMTHKGFTDRLINTPLGAGATITASDVGGLTVAIQAASINNVVEDTTPQLGGNLDVNTKNITSPDGTDLLDINDGSIDIQTNSSSRLDITDSGVRLGAANARVTTILDEDAMGSDSATSLATQQSIKAYIDNQYFTECVNIIPGFGAAETDGRVRLDAVGEHCYSYKYVDGNYVDSDTDIIVRFTYFCTSADATVACKRYVASVAINGSEAWTWNIDNGTAFNIDSTVANRIYNFTYTFSNANFSDGDMIIFALMLNEAARQVQLMEVEYKYKRHVSSS